MYNTEVANITKRFQTILGLIYVPKIWTLTAAQAAAFTTNIQAALINDNQDSRAYKIGKFHTVEIQNGDKTTVSRPDGSEFVTRGATMGWRCITDSGGMDYMKILQSFDGMEESFNVVIITTGTKNGVSFWGTQKWNSSTEVFDFAGFDLSKVETETPMLGEWGDTDRYAHAFRLDDKDQLLVNGWCIDTTIDPFKTGVLPGINDVQLTKLADLDVSGSFTLGMALGSGAINLAQSSAASTWANTARFVATNDATGAAITISTAAVNTAGTAFDIDLDSSDGDYPTSGGYVRIALASVSTLASAGLRYYEGIANNPQKGVSAPYILLKVA